MSDDDSPGWVSARPGLTIFCGYPRDGAAYTQTTPPDEAPAVVQEMTDSMGPSDWSGGHSHAGLSELVGLCKLLRVLANLLVDPDDELVNAHAVDPSVPVSRAG